MLCKSEFVEIGVIRKAHGFKGHIKTFIEDRYLLDLTDQNFVFLEIDGYKVPFEIESLTDKKNLILKLKYIDSVESVIPHRQRPFFLLKNDVVHAKSYVDNLSHLKHYEKMEIWDTQLGFIGIIDRIEEYPQQLMAFIVREAKPDLLIPLNDVWINKTDHKANRIEMDLPDGLIE